MDNVIVGLAGHIDHGKTSFIRAINNFDGDSREDEKQRGITIDISFSNVILNNRQISFIDVPGHQKLVKNMIKGAFSIDCLLLVVSIDDGIMPQTLEHIHIAKLLGITDIVVFISKVDLVGINVDKNQIALLTNKLEQLLLKLEFRIHSINLFSINDTSLVNNAKKVLEKIPKIIRNDFLFRYYCDRVFHKKGFGVVTTGTILGGEIKKGNRIFICNSKKEAIIKNIHNHNIEVDIAKSGQRIALNLDSNVNKGYLLSNKGYLRGFNKIDCVIYLVKDTTKLCNVIFFIGTMQLNARINILEKKENIILATITLDANIFSVFKDRFIIRDDLHTIGGGLILNPISDPIKKSQKIELLKFLLNDDFLLAFNTLVNIHKLGFGLVQSMQRFKLDYNQSLRIADGLKNVFIDKDNKVIYNLDSIKIIKEYILSLITKNSNAIFSANSISNNLKWASSSFIQLALDNLVSQNLIIKDDNNLYVNANCNMSSAKQSIKDSILKILSDGNITPKAPYNIYDDLNIDRNFGDKIFKELTHSRVIIRLAHNVFVLNSVLSLLMEELKKIIINEGYIDIDIFKKYYGISRKYIICYLDYLDKFGDISRVGDKRVKKESIKYGK